MYNATIVFMDMVGFSKLATPTQKQLVEELTFAVAASVEPLLTSDCELRLVVLPTGDGMALGFLNCSGTGKQVLEWLLDVLEAAKTWAVQKRISLRIGINCGDVEVIRDINGNRNLCGHAINDAQRVMDAANDNGVLWSKSAVEYHFGKMMNPVIRQPYEFLEPADIAVKHEVHIEVRQFTRTDGAPGWDNSPLKSRWKDSYVLSARPWSQIDYLDERWASARQVAMVHVNGAIFRDRRWKLGSTSGEPRPHDPTQELQLTTEPFGPDLEQFLVFIPTEKCYDLLVREYTADGDFESYGNCMSFWRNYLRKLCRERSQVLKARETEASQLRCELRGYDMSGCIMYYFDWSSPGGLIRGAPNLWGVELRHSSNFEIKWHDNQSKPPAFSEYVRGLNYLGIHSELLYEGNVNALGTLSEDGIT